MRIAAGYICSFAGGFWIVKGINDGSPIDIVLSIVFIISGFSFIMWPYRPGGHP